MSNLIGTSANLETVISELTAIKSALEKICGLHDARRGGLGGAIADAKALLLELYPETPEYTKTEVEWEGAVGFPSYEVSNYGDIRRCVASRNNRYKSGLLLNPKLANNGYRQVALSVGGKAHHVNVHRIVAIAFLAPPVNDHYIVAHLDGDKLNNYAGNLKWVSNSVNQLHKRQHSGCGALTQAEALAVINRAKSGEKCADMAREFSVTHGVINKIINQVTYVQG